MRLGFAGTGHPNFYRLSEGVLRSGGSENAPGFPILPALAMGSGGAADGRHVADEFLRNAWIFAVLLGIYLNGGFSTAVQRS